MSVHRRRERPYPAMRFAPGRVPDARWKVDRRLTSPSPWDNPGGINPGGPMVTDPHVFIGIKGKVLALDRATGAEIRRRPPVRVQRWRLWAPNFRSFGTSASGKKTSPFRPPLAISERILTRERGEP